MSDGNVPERREACYVDCDVLHRRRVLFERVHTDGGSHVTESGGTPPCFKISGFANFS